MTCFGKVRRAPGSENLECALRSAEADMHTSVQLEPTRDLLFVWRDFSVI